MIFGRILKNTVVRIQQHMKNNKFTLEDFIRVLGLINSLRVSTQPLNEHTDPLSIDDCWNELDDMLNKLGNTFNEQLVTKESIEKLIGKEVQSIEKLYDDKGIFKGVNVVPIQVPEYIELSFTVIPTKTIEDEKSN